MNLHNVKAKPALHPLFRKISILNLLFHKTAHGIYLFIWVPKEIYEDLKTSNPKPHRVALILHEQTHLDRQKAHGFFTWIAKYVFLPEFRFIEEIIADAAGMKYLKEKKQPFNFEQRAKMLSGWLYLKPVSYERALRELQKAWKNV